MMEKKNIDRLFQEKFRDFEANPPEYMWDRIEEELNKKKKRRVIPIWWKLSGVAALLLIGLAVWMAWRSGSGEETRVVSSPQLTEPVEMKPGKVGSPVVPAPGSMIEGVAGSETGVDPKSGSQISDPREGQKLNSAQDAVASEGTDTERIGNDDTQIRTIGNKRRGNRVQSPVLRENGSKVAQSEQVSSGKERARVTERQESENRRKTNSIASPENERENVVIAASERGKAQNLSSGQTNGSSNNVDTNGQPAGEAQVASGKDRNNISPDTQAGPERILSVQEPDKAIAVQDASVKKDSVVVAAAEPNALEELLIEKEEKEKKVTSDAKLNRWQITSNVAPIYFSSASNGSPIDARLEGTNKSYKTSVSYGAGVQYALNKRLSVRSGVNALALEYATNDIFFFQTPNARQLQNVRSNLQGSLIQVESDPGVVAMATSRGDRRYDGMLNQRIGYIEVPVEMSYQLLQKRLGVAIIGGFSTLFLNQNDVSIEGTGLNMTIGEANNLNPMHFSTNVGLGIKYDFLKSLQFKVEPIVKYQLNTFSNDSGNFKPFFLGIYTGLNYRF